MKRAEVDVALVKSFTTDVSAGNPAGIVLQAEGLTDDQMQHVARELGFAETMFVLPSAEADIRLRFFAPQHEVDLCGHGTIATFHTLLGRGLLDLAGQEQKAFTQETRAGLLAVTCHQDGRIVMTQTDPVFGEVEPDTSRIANLLGISKEEIAAGLPLQVVSTGTPKLLIPLQSLAALRAVRPDIEGIKAYCRATTARGFYPFTAESPISGSDFYARQFNPLADEKEDPITGVAAGALGCYAVKYHLYDKQNFTVAQGYDLDMGGKMYVDVSDGVKVGGYAVTYGEQTLNA